MDPSTEEQVKTAELMDLNDSDLTKRAGTSSRMEIRKYLEKHEMLELLRNVPPNMHGMLFQTLWRTGIRVTECINIRKGDIDFDNNTIQIRWLKSRKYLYRRIPLHKSLKMLLYMYTAPIKADERIFPITRQRVDQLCKKYGFGSAHGFRHSFAVNFLRQSDRPMALVELKQLLGHSDIKTTMEYLKIVPKNEQKALEAIDFD